MRSPWTDLLFKVMDGSLGFEPEWNCWWRGKIPELSDRGKFLVIIYLLSKKIFYWITFLPINLNHIKVLYCIMYTTRPSGSIVPILSFAAKSVGSSPETLLFNLETSFNSHLFRNNSIIWTNNKQYGSGRLPGWVTGRVIHLSRVQNSEMRVSSRILGSIIKFSGFQEPGPYQSLIETVYIRLTGFSGVR